MPVILLARGRLGLDMARSDPLAVGPTGCEELAGGCVDPAVPAELPSSETFAVANREMVSLTG